MPNPLLLAMDAQGRTHQQQYDELIDALARLHVQELGARAAKDNHDRQDPENRTGSGNRGPDEPPPVWTVANYWESEQECGELSWDADVAARVSALLAVPDSAIPF
jgi:hypothetical protein